MFGDTLVTFSPGRRLWSSTNLAISLSGSRPSKGKGCSAPTFIWHSRLFVTDHNPVPMTITLAFFRALFVSVWSTAWYISDDGWSRSVLDSGNSPYTFHWNETSTPRLPASLSKETGCDLLA